MKGVGEIFIRSLTSEIHPEKIAKHLDGMMNVVSKYGVPIQFPTAWSQFPGGLFYGDPLWVDEVAMRHPKVPIILTKMGRSIGRYFDSAMTVAMRNVNIYFDVVGTNPQHLRFAIDKLGPHRIMFGTDWSATWRWISVPTTLHKLRLKVLDDAKVTEEERRMILWDNAVRVFKLEKEADEARVGISQRGRIAASGIKGQSQNEEHSRPGAPPPGDIDRHGPARLLRLCRACQPQPAPYPTRQLNIIVPFPAGGSADFFARSVFNKLPPLIGHPVVIENKAGASGIIGAKTVINATPDGYMLLVSSVASVIIPPSLTDPPAFDPLKDLTPITGIGTVPAVLVVRPSLGFKTFAELLAYAKANPGKVNLASSGTGTISHLTAELLMRETGIRIQHVPYRGAPPAVTDLLGGHADIMFSDAPFFLEHIRAGKLIPLAVGTPDRAPSLPSVLTTAELGYPAIVASNTYSLFAPPGTPPDIVGKLNQLVLTVLRDPEVRESFARQEATPAGDTPERFRTLVQSETDRSDSHCQGIGDKGQLATASCRRLIGTGIQVWSCRMTPSSGSQSAGGRGSASHPPCRNAIALED